MNHRNRIAELLEMGRESDKQSKIVNLLLILLKSMNVVAIFLETVDPTYQRY